MNASYLALQLRNAGVEDEEGVRVDGLVISSYFLSMQV